MSAGGLSLRRYHSACYPGLDALHPAVIEQAFSNVGKQPASMFSNEKSRLVKVLVQVAALPKGGMIGMESIVQF